MNCVKFIVLALALVLPSAALADSYILGTSVAAGGGVLGSGTTNTVAKFTAAGTIGNSSLTDDGEKVESAVPIVVPLGSASSPALRFNNSSNTGWYANATGEWLFSAAGQPRWKASGNITLGNSGLLAWSSSFNPDAFADVVLARLAAGHLLQRQGILTQKWSLAETYTDPSNYELGSIAMGSDTMTIGPETAGTGADDMSLNLVTAGAGNLKINGVNGVTGTCSSVTVAKGIVTGCTP